MFNMNFSDAPVRDNGFSLIPKGTKAKVVVKVQPAKVEKQIAEDPTKCFNMNPEKGSVYLNLEITVVGGKYANRKIFNMVGFKSSAQDISNNGGEGSFAQNGKQFMRAMLESARNIAPTDNSANAMAGRGVSSPLDLNGMEFAAYIGVDDKNTDQQGNPDPRNTVTPIVNTDKQYAAIMSGQDVNAPATAAPAAQGGWQAPPAATAPGPTGQWQAPQGGQAPAATPAWAVGAN